jgi:hypothetical protein
MVRIVLLSSGFWCLFSMSLRNADIHIQDYLVSEDRRPPSEVANILLCGLALSPSSIWWVVIVFWRNLCLHLQWRNEGILKLILLRHWEVVTNIWEESVASIFRIYALKMEAHNTEGLNSIIRCRKIVVCNAKDWNKGPARNNGPTCLFSKETKFRTISALSVHFWREQEQKKSFSQIRMLKNYDLFRGSINILLFVDVFFSCMCHVLCVNLTENDELEDKWMKRQQHLRCYPRICFNDSRTRIL